MGWGPKDGIIYNGIPLSVYSTDSKGRVGTWYKVRRPINRSTERNLQYEDEDSYPDVAEGADIGLLAEVINEWHFKLLGDQQQQTGGCPPGTPCDQSLAQKASNYVDPAGLVVDGVLVTAFGSDGTVMKMQSGQRLVFTDPRIIKILKDAGAAKQAITLGTVLGKVGTGLGYAGIGLTWIQVGTGDKHWIQGTMDTAMGIVGMAAPGPGTVISVFYFMATQDYSAPQIYRDPRIVPMDNTYVAPSYKSMLYKTGN
jgi:hypothetical protein